MRTHVCLLEGSGGMLSPPPSKTQENLNQDPLTLLLMQSGTRLLFINNHTQFQDFWGGGEILPTYETQLMIHGKEEETERPASWLN